MGLIQESPYTNTGVNYGLISMSLTDSLWGYRKVPGLHKGILPYITEQNEFIPLQKVPGISKVFLYKVQEALGTIPTE